MCDDGCVTMSEGWGWGWMGGEGSRVRGEDLPVGAIATATYCPHDEGFGQRRSEGDRR